MFRSLANEHIYLVDPADTLYRRDSFLGGYAAEYLWQKQRGEWNIEEAIKFGCRVSAKTISQLGAQSALPWYDEL
jgi:ribokinase